MKDEDILKIAMQCDPEFTRRTYYLDLLNFGAAIAAAEREACAKVCREIAILRLDSGMEPGCCAQVADMCNVAILKRSNASLSGLPREGD